MPVIFESARISARLLLADMGIDCSWIDEIDAQRGKVEKAASSADLRAGGKLPARWSVTSAN